MPAKASFAVDVYIKKISIKYLENMPVPVLKTPLSTELYLGTSSSPDDSTYLCKEKRLGENHLDSL